MYFRRELDFDEVVDWQMTASPAAKREGIKGEGSRPALPNAPWLVQRAAAPSPARTRTELPPGRTRITIPEQTELNFDRFDEGRAFAPIRVRQVEVEVQTMFDPVRDILHIRLTFNPGDGSEIQYQQVAFPQEQLMSLRGPIVVMRKDITPGRDIVVEVAPIIGPDGLPRMRFFMESDA